MSCGLLAVYALLTTASPVTAEPPAGLFPFVLPWDDATGGVTDLSGWLHKPAGRFGPVRAAADGHLYTGRERLRGFGVDLTFSACVPTHEQAEKVAGRLAKFGINVLRFHIMDMRRYPDGLLARGDQSTRRLDPEGLERLDYFIAQLTRRGIYTYLCLLNYRPLNAADGLPREIEQLGGPYQGRHLPGFWDPAHLELQKEYARQLLTHRNQYTGLTYAADPAVAFVELNNENGLFHAWLGDKLDALPAVLLTSLRKRWNEWLRQRYGDDRALAEAWGRGAQPLGDEMLRDGRFARGAEEWRLEQHAPAAATVARDTTGPDEWPGFSSVCLNVTALGTEPWHLRFQQPGLSVTTFRCYTVDFWAKAERAARLRCSIEPTRAPWHVLASGRPVELDTHWRHFRQVLRVKSIDPLARLVFDLPPQLGRVWLSNVSVKPGGISGALPEEQLAQGSVGRLSHATANERSEDVIRDWTEFLWTTEDAYWQSLYRYVKDDLQVRGLVIGTAVGCSTPNLMAKLDCVDAHVYWQHPVFPGRPWDPENWFIRNLSMVNARGGVLTSLALRRVLAKPFCSTEYGSPSPNTYGSETHLLRGAYGALQDWDYLSASRYAQKNDFDLQRVRGFFDIDQHPSKMLTLLPAAAMFVRGDVKPARQQVVARLSRADELALLPRQHAWDLVHAGQQGVPPEAVLVHRVALAVEGQTPPADALRPEQLHLTGDQFRADTGELLWDQRTPQRGVVTVDTDRSKAVIGFGGGQRYALGTVTVEPGPTLQDGWSTLSLTAMDGTLTAAPARVLITATGYLQNTNQVWSSLEHSSVGRNWGTAPTLVEGIPARFTLPYRAAGTQVWALDERGQRRQPVPVEATADGRAVVVIGPQWRTLWYEVVAQ